MKKVTVSAPGKLMLLGEHAVVYGHPCLVTAVDRRLYLSISAISNQQKVIINAAGVEVKGYEKSFDELGIGDIPKGAQFIEIAIKNFFESNPKIMKQVEDPLLRIHNDKIGLSIKTRSEFASMFGFGSSSAVTVCTIKALSEVFDRNLSQKELFDLSYKTVLDIQGNGSGFDVASAIYGGTIYFENRGERIVSVISDSIENPDSGISGNGDEEKFPLLVGYSGVKADTVTLVKQVALLGAQQPDVVNGIFQDIEKIVHHGREALEKKDFVLFGKLMDQNQDCLVKLGISTEKLNSMITAARDAGALGAKLSGAGGGDCMIAITPNSSQQSVKEAIENAGGEIMNVSTNTEGVRVET